jgi:hypothetical protein
VSVHSSLQGLARHTSVPGVLNKFERLGRLGR